MTDQHGYPVVDAHCHVGQQWFEPVEVLLFHMERAGVDFGILTLPVFAADDSYQRECVARHPGKFANVVSIAPWTEDPLARLEALAARGVSALRIRASDHYDGNQRALWSAADRLGLTVTCLSGESDLSTPEFRGIVESYPELPIVLEHLGVLKPVGAATGEERRRVFDLAEYPHVSMKIHGLAEFAPRLPDPFQEFPFETPIPPLLELAVERFTPDRLLWGSDFPNACAREGYANSLRYTQQQLSGLSLRERAKIFGANARRLFPSVA